MVEEYPDGVKVIRDFLSIPECQNLIESSEVRGYEEAAIDTGNGQEIFKEIRNNDRLFFDDEKLAKKLFEKLSPYLPQDIHGWKVYSLNERFRFYRYENEQYFKWHRDVKKKTLSKRATRPQATELTPNSIGLWPTRVF